jgi:hypothetical protein
MSISDEVTEVLYESRILIERLTAEVERLRAALLEDEPTVEQVNDACLSYAHDYGLMNREDREKLSWQAKWWLHAWRKTLARAALQEPCT